MIENYETIIPKQNIFTKDDLYIENLKIKDILKEK